MMMFYQIAASLVLMTTTMTSFQNVQFESSLPGDLFIELSLNLQNFVLSFSVFVAYVMQFFLYCLFGEMVVSKVSAR